MEESNHEKHERRIVHIAAEDPMRMCHFGSRIQLTTNTKTLCPSLVLSTLQFFVCFVSFVVISQLESTTSFRGSHFNPLANAFAVALIIASEVIVAREVASTPLTPCLSMICRVVSVNAE